MAEQTIYCTIEETPINIAIEETPIKVTIEGGGQLDKVWAILDTYLIQEDLTGQVDGLKTEFTTTYDIYNNFLSVWVDGIKEKAVTKTGSKTFELTLPPDVGDFLEAEYIKYVSS